MKIKIALLFVTILASCSSGVKYEYWDISKFSITENALENGESVKVLYTSLFDVAVNNTRPDAYVHLVVVSQKTGDTVNVLTTQNNGFNKEDVDSVFVFFKADHPVAKLFQEDPEKLKNMRPEDLKEHSDPKRKTKVIRDPKFDHIADNHFPAIIGVVGRFTFTPGVKAE